MFKNFGTARVNSRDLELEFVGARRESYSHDSRKPVVEDGTLVDDISRRDFTVNALALRVNAEGFGEVVDLFNGLADMERRVLRTPLDPDVTFSDDPLRMMRAVRFATQLRFAIDGNTYEGICRNASRLEIISRERIAEELNKIMKAPKPSIGWRLLLETGLLHYILPELEEMQKVDVVNGRAHKRWDPKSGWTFHNHNFVGAKMVPLIFRDLRLPLGEPMKFVQTMVELHMRPIVLSEEIVTDSAVRRLLFDAGDNIDSLMTLCEADITTGRPEKLKTCLDNFALVRRKLVELEERDRIRNFQPPITGNDIMTIFNIPPSKPIKELKEAIKDAILDGQIPNDRLAAYECMLPIAEKIGLTKVNDLPDVCIESQKD